MEIIVYDLDNTLRDTSCGGPYIPKYKSKTENWICWQGCVNDYGKTLPTCNSYMVECTQDKIQDVYILTSSTFGTQDWLNANCLPMPDRIIEREMNDNRDPFTYKKEWIDKHNAYILKWVDDSQKVCDYIRRYYPHIEVVEVGNNSTPLSNFVNSSEEIKGEVYDTVIKGACDKQLELN